MSKSRDELVAEYEKLKAANEAATSWGAAVGARHERMKQIEATLSYPPAPPRQPERYILVGWFQPYNDYHGFQQVHQDHEGEEGQFPLYVRECDLLKIEVDDKMPAPRTPQEPESANNG